MQSSPSQEEEKPHLDEDKPDKDYYEEQRREHEEQQSIKYKESLNRVSKRHLRKRRKSVNANDAITTKTTTTSGTLGDVTIQHNSRPSRLRGGGRFLPSIPSPPSLDSSFVDLDNIKAYLHGGGDTTPPEAIWVGAIGLALVGLSMGFYISHSSNRRGRQGDDGNNNRNGDDVLFRAIQNESAAAISIQQEQAPPPMMASVAVIISKNVAPQPLLEQPNEVSSTNDVDAVLSEKVKGCEHPRSVDEDPSGEIDSTQPFHDPNLCDEKAIVQERAALDAIYTPANLSETNDSTDTSNKVLSEMTHIEKDDKLEHLQGSAQKDAVSCSDENMFSPSTNNYLEELLISPRGLPKHHVPSLQDDDDSCSSSSSISSYYDPVSQDTRTLEIQDRPFLLSLQEKKIFRVVCDDAETSISPPELLMELSPEQESNAAIDNSDKVQPMVECTEEKQYVDDCCSVGDEYYDSMTDNTNPDEMVSPLQNVLQVELPQAVYSPLDAMQSMEKMQRGIICHADVQEMEECHSTICFNQAGAMSHDSVLIINQEQERTVTLHTENASAKIACNNTSLNARSEILDPACGLEKEAPVLLPASAPDVPTTKECNATSFRTVEDHFEASNDDKHPGTTQPEHATRSDSIEMMPNTRKSQVVTEGENKRSITVTGCPVQEDILLPDTSMASLMVPNLYSLSGEEGPEANDNIPMTNNTRETHKGEKVEHNVPAVAQAPQLTTIHSIVKTCCLLQDDEEGEDDSSYYDEDGCNNNAVGSRPFQNNSLFDGSVSPATMATKDVTATPITSKEIHVSRGEVTVSDDSYDEDCSTGSSSLNLFPSSYSTASPSSKRKSKHDAACENVETRKDTRTARRYQTMLVTLLVLSGLTAFLFWKNVQRLHEPEESCILDIEEIGL